jgi:hypothetical protein
LATVQEISGAASQIMVAVEQISKGGQQQASAEIPSIQVRLRLELDIEPTSANDPRCNERK